MCTLTVARGDSLWQSLHFCLQYLDPLAKLDNKILQFHGPRHSKVKVSCKLDFHHLEHGVLHRRTGSTCQALWCSTAELCAHWAWDIFWNIHMTHIRHSSWNTALNVDTVTLSCMFEHTCSINPPGTNSCPDLLHPLKDLRAISPIWFDIFQVLLTFWAFKSDYKVINCAI